MTIAPASTPFLTLRDGDHYDIETTGGAVWPHVRWNATHCAFMLNAKGGIPLGFVARVRPDDHFSWLPLGAFSLTRTDVGD